MVFSISPSGSSPIGAGAQFTARLAGLTPLNRTARSNYFNSSWVNAISSLSPPAISAVFAIINTSFEISGQFCGNQPDHLLGIFCHIN